MHSSTKRILFVEDDLNLGFVVKDQLEDHGFTIDWATKGRQALSKALSKEYDIALLDVMLPEMEDSNWPKKLLKPSQSYPFFS